MYSRNKISAMLFWAKGLDREDQKHTSFSCHQFNLFVTIAGPRDDRNIQGLLQPDEYAAASSAH
jgi:hypothetical protein